MKTLALSMLGMLLTVSLANADCDRTQIKQNKCQLCYVVNGKNILKNPWDKAHPLTDKERVSSALNSVMCKYLNPEIFKKNALPSNNKEITDHAIYSSIEKIYAALGTSNINSSESNRDSGTGCSDLGGFSKNNLSLNNISYFAKMLNSCMVRSGGEFKDIYCIDITKLKRDYSDLRTGLAGLLRKAVLIDKNQAQVIMK